MKAAAAPVGQPWLWDAGLWPPRRPHADLRLRADARGCDGGVRQELAAGVVQLKPASLNVKTTRSWRGSVPYAPRTGGAYDSHHGTAAIAGRTRRRCSRVAARGA